MKFRINLLIFTGNWEDNWIYSKAEGKEFGKFELTAGKFYNDAENDKGKFMKITQKSTKFASEM